jgi:hypothetical protein
MLPSAPEMVQKEDYDRDVAAFFRSRPLAVHPNGRPILRNT